MTELSDTAEIIYVSWGGTGRGASLRSAYQQAIAANRGLLYLAILDEEHFSDVEDNLLNVVGDELQWLIDTQVRLVQQELGNDVPVRVMVRSGDIDDEVTEVIQLVGTNLVLIGAPVPLARHTSVDEFVNILTSRTGTTVEVVEPTSGDGRLSRG